MRYQTFRLTSFTFFILLFASSLSAQWQINHLSVPSIINFDSTFNGVNNAPYAGLGYAPAPLSGALDSDAWAIFGLSSGDLNFGDTGIIGDYARGLTNGGVSTGGVYSMNVGVGGVVNRALGVQAGGSDFTPGYHLLRVVNSTTDTVGSIDLSYNVLEFNDNGRSSLLSFYWGSSILVMNHIAGLDFISTEISNISPTWQSHYRSTQIQHNLFPGDTVYFKWYSDDFGGSGSRDEIAIDDITVSFLPLGNQAPQIGSVRTLPSDPQAGQSFNISSIITDSDGVDSAFMIWGLDSMSLTHLSQMQQVGPDSFITVQPIPGQADSTWLYFKIVASDSHQNPVTDTSSLFKVPILDSLLSPQVGDLIITELMINPASVSDARGEYIEVYNASKNTYNLKGFSLIDSGGDSASIDSRLIIKPRQFLVFARDSSMSLNGGLESDYEYSSFNLNNLNDEVYLVSQNGDTIDQVEYVAGSVWSSVGSAVTYVGATHQDNNNLSLWKAATLREPGFSGLTGDLGSPGFEGVDQVVDHLVFVDGIWSEVPDSTSFRRNAIVQSGEQVTFTNSAELKSIQLKPHSSMDLGTHQLNVVDTMYLIADSTGYSQLIGKVEGRVLWQSFLQSNSTARWFNLAIPLVSTIDSLDLNGNGKINTLVEAGGDTGKVNIWSYDAAQLNSQTAEGTWIPISNKQQSTLGVGFSMYSGSPHFGQLPQTLSATGRLINHDLRIDLDNISGLAQYNFVANPFASQIDWDEITADNPGINKTYFMYDDGPDSTWRAYNSIAGVVAGGAQSLLAPGQAFFLNANGQSYMDLETDCRTFTGSAGLFRKVLPPAIVIKAITDRGRIDHTYIGFSANATDSVDRTLDALKRLNRAKYSPNIYSKLDDHKFYYNFIPDVFIQKTIAIELVTGGNGKMTLEFDLNSIDPAWNVEIEDLLNGTIHDLRNGSYTINYLSALGTRKFLLHINTAGLGAFDNQNTQTQITMGSQLLYQGDLIDRTEYVMLTDVNGRVLSQCEIEHFSNNAIQLSEIDVAPGVYILCLSDRDGAHLIRRKVVLR